MNHFDVVLVSSFGQLEALACEFGRKGLNTLLIDVTDQLGSWPLEDREGPFGDWFYDQLNGAWLEVEKQGDLVQTSDRGFVIWPKSGGPVALRGPLTQFQMGRHGWKSTDKSKSTGTEFDSGWLSWLSQSFLGTRFQEWHPNLLTRSTQSLEAAFGVRSPTRSGLMARREWVRSQNVQVWAETHILDAVKSGLDLISGLEVRGPVSGVIKTQSLVWGLTSLETDFMSFRVRDKIFGFEVNKPDWCWVRYRLQLETRELTQSWPHHMVLVEHPSLPLTHTDFIVLQRTVLNNQFDAWIRIPESKRFHQAYLNRMKTEVVEKIKTRLPQLQISVIFEPQEMSYTSKELGPRPLCQYSSELKKRSFKNKNLYFDGPEIWQEYTSEHATLNQKKILEEALLQWRKMKNENQKFDKNQQIAGEL